MSRYLPSLKGWFAVLVVLIAFFTIPSFFHARLSGRPTPPMPIGNLINVAMILVGCAIACLLAFIRGRVPDKVLAILTGLVTLYLIAICIRAVLV